MVNAHGQGGRRLRQFGQGLGAVPAPAHSKWPNLKVG